MNEGANLTLTRRRQRRPDLQTECHLPDHLSRKVVDVERALRASIDVADDDKPADIVKAMNATCSALVTLRTTARTPELQLRAVSKITSSVRECRLGHPENRTEYAALTASERAFMDTLILRFVFPFLLDCRVRYLHKALTTLFRTTYVITAATLEAFESIFLDSLCNWCAPSARGTAVAKGDEMHLFVSTMSTSPVTVAASSDSLKMLKTSKERVMYFLNSIDGLSSTVMPMMPSVFSSTFLTVLPLLGECLQWAVEQALANSQASVATEAEHDPTGEEKVGNTASHARHTGSIPNATVATNTTIFGEDIEHVRFCARVVATYMHKYMARLTRELRQQCPGSTGAASIHHNLAGLLWPASLMFSSDAFPKDVLNAAGLLLASLLTVRTCDAAMLVAVCRAVCEVNGERVAAVAQKGCEHLGPSFLSVEAATSELLGAGADTQVSSHTFPALSALCAGMTKNARFAVLKGLLAHLSAPIHGDLKGVSVLLLPTPMHTAQMTPMETTCVPLYDIILPYAQRYANTLSEPETRFMAIQCMDSVVRHLAAVLSVCQRVLREAVGGATLDGGSPSADETAEPHNVAKCARREAPQPQKAKRAAAASPDQWKEGIAVVHQLLPACLPSLSMLRALHTVTQLAMSLWDDGTQQMSGTLYDTYDEVLRAREMAVWFQQTLSSLPLSTASLPPDLIAQANAAAPLAKSLDLVHTLRDALSIQNERRGKYHALLGLMTVLEGHVFLNALCGDGTDGLAAFAAMLLSGATNHKIGNICGEVFCKTAAIVRQCATSPTGAEQYTNGDGLLKTAILTPLAMAIVVEGYVTVASNVDAPTAISNTVAHFVTPLLRQGASMLPMLLEALDSAAKKTARSSASANPRTVQGIVEILSRARSVGLDVSVYLAPGHPTFDMLRRTTQAQAFELRNAALSLLVMSPKKAEPVVAWQCDLIEAFVSLNLQLGGDNTARKMLFETMRKWVRRIHDTFGARQADVGEMTAYQTTLLAHARQLCEILAAHIGTPQAPLAVERRVASMCLYKMLLSTLLSVLLGSMHGDVTELPVNEQSLVAPYFVARAVPMLVVDLSDGWEQTRVLAREVLQLFARCAPCSVFDGDECVKRLLVKADAYNDLVHARTYRNAEGAVMRFTLSALHTSASATWHSCGQHNDTHALVLQEIKAIDEACQSMAVLEGHAALDFIVSTPLHGRLSLCIELTAPLFASRVAAQAVKEVSDALLRASSRVLSVCSSLVGADGEGETDAEVVDCRGHVYTKGDPGAEAMMRRVVNNTWLSVRVATAAITRVLTGAKVEQLDVEVVRGACCALVHVLLCTKHNGVMRCAREALKKALEILIRSRHAELHAVPREMLDHLLGDQGVTSTDVHRMLRRSQGLPHAILAVLEAEDNTMPFVLFGVAMSTLMRVAKAMHSDSSCAGGRPHDPTDSSSSCVPSSSSLTPHQALPDLALSRCSNGLNVLKFVFEDHALSDRAVAYLEEAFTTATSGFNHESWYIRNSCLMLFASVLQRLIGEHPSMGGAGVNTSLHDLEKRAPASVVFALDTLHTARRTETLALFPILQMLSMLSPDPPQLWNGGNKQKDGDNNDDGDLAVVSAMVNAVAQCGNSSSLMVRSASAVALACVVPVDGIQTVMLRVAEGFSVRNRRSSLNGLHGALLQLHQLHRQYVGTRQSSSRRRLLSGYATRGVRQLVSATAATCLLHAWDEETRVRVCACPTTAAALLSLLADVLFFGHQNDLPVEAETALIVLAHPILMHCLVSPHSAAFDVTDRGAVCEHASAVLLASITAVSRRHSTNGDDTATEIEKVMALWGAALDTAQRDLLAARNVDQHQDLVTGLLDAYLGADAASRPDMDAFLSTTTRLTGFDLCEANVRAIERGVAPHVGRQVGNEQARAEQWLGCLTSSALATHTRFAQLVVSGGAEAGAQQQQERWLRHSSFTKLVESYRAIFSAHMASENSDARAAGTGLTDGTYAVALETEAPAIELITRAAVVAGSVDDELIGVLTFYSDPDRAEVLRRVVVDCLHLCLGKATDGAAAGVSANVRATLFFLLLRLLCDDASAVREAACQVCSAIAVDTRGGCRDQFTCVLSVTKTLSAWTQHQVVSVETMKSLCEVYLHSQQADGDRGDTSHADIAAGDNAGNEEDGVGEDADHDNDADADADEEVLFEKEADNMFAEPGLMVFLMTHILYGAQGADKRAHAPHFPVLDRLLGPAADRNTSEKATVSLLSFCV